METQNEMEEMKEGPEGQEYVKCSGCRCMRHIVKDFEIYKGTRRKTCLVCKENRKKNKCPHGKEKKKCGECNAVPAYVHTVGERVDVLNVKVQAYVYTRS